MSIQTVTDAIRYVGVDDNTLALFENQYPVQPMGVSYNSYVILDEKIAVMDSVDARAAEEWLSNVARVLEGRSPDYLVVTHMEPDHSGSLMRLAQKYPEMKIVGNAKTFTMIKQFFGTGAFSEDRMLEVGERDTLDLPDTDCSRQEPFCMRKSAHQLSLLNQCRQIHSCQFPLKFG